MALLSRIKPLLANPLQSHSPINPKLKKQVNDNVKVLKTQQNWSKLDEELRLPALLVDMSPFVFDRIQDVETGVKLFDWLWNQRKDQFFSNESACHMNDEVRMKGKMIVAIYSMLMSGLCEGDFKRAEETFREMQSCGHVPNVVTYTTLIRSFAKGGSTLGNRAEVTLVTDNAKVTLNSENAH
ncbi:hypothetical protein HID58_057484 [Brassica napus]|uniref:Pentatricopeptide repeat-containing protein n=1 Tax=Brassica napus TaxID=3708 RepID=A0ABQ8AR85_BRANA|nr:hypothetical protein HID58_057484 [Brassica napus]